MPSHTDKKQKPVRSSRCGSSSPSARHPGRNASSKPDHARRSDPLSSGHHAGSPPRASTWRRSAVRGTLARSSGMTAFFMAAWKWLMHFAYLVYSVLNLGWEVAAGVAGIPMATPEYKALRGQLTQADSYPEWRAVGRMLDDIEGYGEWRTEESSIYFSFEGIMRCMQELAEIKRYGNTRALVEVLLSRVQRSLYGVNNTMLYEYRTGTKNVIHSYTSLVCYLIRGLAEMESIGATADGGMPDPATTVTPRQRYDALKQMQVVYGSTALVLNGGMVVAPLHLGVAKALYNAGLLPQVIYGFRSGAIIAALICCAADVGSLDESKLDFAALAHKDPTATSLRRWRRLRKRGHLMDSSVLLRFMRDNVGDVTFLEAYRRTGRVLNIQYTSFYASEVSDKMQRCSSLLNYLTTPDVLVYSAAVSSMASLPFMFQRVPLLARTLDGAIAEYDPAVLVKGYAQRMTDDKKSPPMNSLHRLRELFHVHYFIVSECSSVLKPSFLRRQVHSGWYHLCFGWLHFVLTEVLRLLWVLVCATPLEPYVATALQNDMAECDIVGDTMVILPELSWREWWRLWGALSREEMKRCIVQSERQVWPRLEEIRMNFAIEEVIAGTLHQLRQKYSNQIRD